MVNFDMKNWLASHLLRLCSIGKCHTWVCSYIRHMIDLSHTEYESSDCAIVQGLHQSLPTLPTQVSPLPFISPALLLFPPYATPLTSNSSPSPILFTAFPSDSLFSGSPGPSTMTHHFQPLGKSLSSGSQRPAHQLQHFALSYHPQPQTSKRVTGRPPKLPKNVTKAEKKAGQRRASKPKVTPKQRLGSGPPAKKKPRLVSKLSASKPKAVHVDTPKKRLSGDLEEQPAKKKPRLVSKLGKSNPKVIHVDTPKRRLSSDLEGQPAKKKTRLVSKPIASMWPRRNLQGRRKLGESRGANLS